MQLKDSVDERDKIHNNVNEQRLVTLLQDMIRIRSYTGQELELAEFLAKWLENQGFEVDLQELKPTEHHKRSANVVAILRGSGGGKNIMLNGHLDTDPACGKWKYDPWNPVVFDGNKINGIGTTNMKGSDASMIESALAIKDAGITLKGDVIIALVAEELQGGWGISKVLEKYSADAGIVTEASFFDIGYNPSPGISRAQIQIYGSSTHIHELGKGANATVKMANVITALNKFDFPYTRSVAPAKNPEMANHPVLCIGNSKSGIGDDFYDERPATTSDRAIIKLDIRYDVNQTEEMIYKDLENLLDLMKREDPGLKTRLEPIPNYITRPSYQLPWDSHILGVLGRAHKSVFGREIKKMSVLPGGADSAFMWTKKKIPTVVYGPPGYSLNDTERFVDTEDLYVKIDDLKRLSEVLAFCCLEICNESGS